MMWWKKDLWRNRLFTNADVLLIENKEKEDENISLHINTDVSSHLE